VKRRRHLNALVTLYPIEFLFITWAVMHKGFEEPSATLDG